MNNRYERVRIPAKEVDVTLEYERRGLKFNNGMAPINSSNSKKGFVQQPLYIICFFQIDIHEPAAVENYKKYNGIIPGGIRI